MSARFAAPVSDSNEAELRSSAVPQKTKSVTEWGIKIWNEWAAARAGSTENPEDRVGPETSLLQMPVKDFAYWLGKFILEIRKRDGHEYPPKSLYALVCCFKRHFELSGVHDINPLSPGNAVFGDFRITLDAEMKRLHASGLGVRTKQAEPILPDEEAILWAKGLFGTHNAQVITNTVYFYNCKVFGLRSIDEHRNLLREQFSKKVDEKSRVYLEYVDYGNKTMRGGLKHMKVEPKVLRQYEDVSDPDHCVVNIFVTYLLYAPRDVDYFYCRALPDDGSGIPRFGKQPVGRNKLAKIIPDMCKLAGIDGRKTGHSGKVTCATTLYRQNFGDQLIKERTGHRSLEALHKYKRTGSDQQYEVSMALLPMVNSKLSASDKESTIEKPASDGKENKPGVAVKPTCKSNFFVKPNATTPVLNSDDEDDFKPMKKKRKPNPEDLKRMFEHSSLQNCTININYS